MAVLIQVPWELITFRCSFHVIDRDRDNGSQLDQLQESLVKYLINRPKLVVPLLWDPYASASSPDIHIQMERANKSSSIFHAPNPRRHPSFFSFHQLPSDTIQTGRSITSHHISIDSVNSVNLQSRAIKLENPPPDSMRPIQSEFDPSSLQPA